MKPIPIFFAVLLFLASNSSLAQNGQSRPTWTWRDWEVDARKTLCAEADSLKKVEEYRRAIYLYTIIIDTNEPCEMVYFNRGSCKSQVGDHRGAISDLNTYLHSVKGTEHKSVDYHMEHESSPFTIHFVQLAYQLLGYSYISLGNFEEGCLNFGKAGEYGAEDAYEDMKVFCN